MWPEADFDMPAYILHDHQEFHFTYYFHLLFIQLALIVSLSSVIYAYHAMFIVVVSIIETGAYFATY